MGQRRPGRGPDLPYRPLAGVVPCPGGWLIIPGKLQGITLFPDPGELVPTFTDVLDRKPSFEIIALAAPVGLPTDASKGGRSCDKEARKLLGFPRSGTIVSAPARWLLAEKDFGKASHKAGGLSPITWTLINRLREVDAEMQPYRQRTVYEVHPELSFHQLNGDRPMTKSKHLESGRKERRALLEKRLPGVERSLDNPTGKAKLVHRIDAAACLWTARRIASRNVLRVPQDPEWDDAGLRMEIVR
jgi:predicted RNase H-like nuclease